ncbi:MAG: alpha/beta hydrolase [Acidimicrobiales bacterium]|nr:alpha/beta hydrolase [Acidimicrobiales bacterium]MCB9395212.1 alpha/beta hydrolase [Acidimicrobiaceae bacterium]
MITSLGRTFAVDGVELAWDRWGGDAGVPLLLCHGYSGSSHDFALHIEGLAERRPVLALDHRGHGASTNVGSLDAYSIDRLALNLIALIDDAVGGPVDLLGHSMGGAISIAVTLARPDLVRSLVLMDTTGWSFRPDDPAMAAMFESFMTGFDPAGGLPDLSSMEGPESALIAAATPAEWQRLKEVRSASFDPWAMKALGTELFTGSADRARLAAITCPVTVVVGEHDHPFVGQAAELAATVADGTHVVIDGAYHSPQLTHPAAWRAAIEAHLAR